MKIYQDIKANSSNTKGLFFIIFFRISAFFTKNLLLKIIGFPIRFLYKVIIEWLIGIDIPDLTKIGKGFKVYHGQSLVINKETIIGDFVTIRQSTTIGNSKSKGKSPIIENNVTIGSNVVIIGEILIGKNSIIAAGSVVVKDVLECTLVAGNPAKFIKKINE